MKYITDILSISDGNRSTLTNIQSTKVIYASTFKTLPSNSTASFECLDLYCNACHYVSFTALIFTIIALGTNIYKYQKTYNQSML